MCGARWLIRFGKAVAPVVYKEFVMPKLTKESRKLDFTVRNFLAVHWTSSPRTNLMKLRIQSKRFSVYFNYEREIDPDMKMTKNERKKKVLEDSTESSEGPTENLEDPSENLEDEDVESIGDEDLDLEE